MNSAVGWMVMNSAVGWMVMNSAVGWTEMMVAELDRRPGGGAALNLRRTIGIEEYRGLLADRQAVDGALGAEAVGHAALVFNLVRLHTRLSRDFDALHRRRGWTWAGFRVMNVLWAVGPVELRDVARLSGASRAAISSALNTLERDGLVARVRDESDRRLVRIELTERGMAEFRAGVADQVERERRWFGALDPADRRRLTELLGRLADQKDLERLDEDED